MTQLALTSVWTTRLTLTVSKSSCNEMAHIVRHFFACDLPLPCSYCVTVSAVSVFMAAAFVLFCTDSTLSGLAACFAAGIVTG